jgi:tRNA-specific 2-thiouridylase
MPDSGEIVDSNGDVIGEHSGIHRYTVGQRRGIGISSEHPLYVVSIDATNNRVVVGRQEELLSREFIASGVNWIAFDKPRQAVRALVRVRYRHLAAMATITPLENERVRVVFDEPQRAITPGQATVFYGGDEVVGGGWIVRRQEQETGADGRSRRQD